MRDLAQKIRTEFDRPFWRATEASSSGAQKTMAAIRAVLEVHSPSSAAKPVGGGRVCRCCDSWPCPTVLGVADALGVCEDPED